MKKIYEKVLSVVTAVVLTIMAFFAVPASQAHATIAELFAAVDITGLSSNVQTLLIAFIGITLLFVGNRFIKKSLRG